MKPFIVPGRLVVQFSPGVDPIQSANSTVRFGRSGLDQLSAQIELRSSEKVFPWRHDQADATATEQALSQTYQLEFSSDLEVTEVIDQIRSLPGVVMAEPVWIFPVRDQSPNDPSLYQQWFVNKIGLPGAWSLQTGSRAVKLAMVDTGVNYKHPDLKGNIWINPGEDLDGDRTVYDADDLNGVDDDGNGVVDDLIGYDFLTDIGVPVPLGEDPGVVDTDPMDFHGHGTHCSGISAAMTNNSTGGAGLAGGWSGGSFAWGKGAQIMCLRAGAAVEGGIGYVNSVDCATAIDYASLMGADVINCSWGGSSVQAMAIQNAQNAGAIVVHAAGNDGKDLPDYLDTFLGSIVLSVASTTSGDYKSSFSNYGDWVDVSAPGSSIYSTVTVGDIPSYASWSGTSMAAPMVGGLALLIRSVDPDLSVFQVKSIIKNTVDDIDGINPTYAGKLGTGRINVLAALSGLSNANFTNDVWQGEPPFTVSFTDLSPHAPTTWNWSFGTDDSSYVQNPIYTYDDPGLYTVSLEVTDSLGINTETREELIWVHHDSLRIGTGSAAWEEQVEIPVYLNNSAVVYGLDIVFTYSNPDGITWAGANVNGLRTESNFTVSNFAYSPSLQSRGIRLSPAYDGAAIFPDTGAVINLVFEVPFGSDVQSITLDTISWSGHKSGIKTMYGDYMPAFSSGTLEAVYTGCCGLFASGFTGNTDCDTGGNTNLADITRLIDFVYISGAPLCCYENGNTSGDLEDKVNLADITRLIDHVYISKGSTEPCH